MKNAKSQTKEVRDEQLREFCTAGINRADMATRSGLPLVACTIARSVVPLLLTRIYHTAIEHNRNISNEWMMEAIKDRGLITDGELLAIRSSLIALTDYASGRDASDIVRTMKQLRKLAMEVEAETQSPATVTLAESSSQAPKPLLRRWASSAAALFMVGN